MKNRAILLYGTAETSADLLYASGFSAPDPVVMLVRGRERALVVPPLEEGRAKASVPRGVAVYTPEQLIPGGPRKRRPRGDWAAALLKKLRARSVTVAPDFPLGVARSLEKRGIGVRVAKEALFRRDVKTAAELKRIAAVQKAAVAGIRAATTLVRKARVDSRGFLLYRGRRLTSEALRAEIAHVLLKHGCGGPAPIVAGGKRAADPHDIGRGPLRAGETIVMDIFPRHTGNSYWGDITRTIVKGKPSARAQAMYDAVKLAQKTALSRIRAGVKTAAVHEAVKRVFKDLGFKTEKRPDRRVGFFHGTGHGVGLEIHEKPFFAENNDRLREGNVVTVEPGLYYPEDGGVRIEDTVVVTRRGWRYLATCEKTFSVQ